MATRRPRKQKRHKPWSWGYGKDHPLRAFWQECEKGDLDTALAMLGDTLGADPFLFSEVEGVFSYLRDDGVEEPEWRAERLDYLCRRFVEGITRGAKVKICRRRTRPVGPPRMLFPHLGERDGYYRSPAAETELTEAFEFYGYVNDLQRWIRGSQDWRVIGREYRERPRATIDAVAYDTQMCFEVFKRHHGLTGLALTEDDYRRIVEQALNRVYRRRDVHYDITCQLITTLHLPCLDRQDELVSSQLIKSTVQGLYDYYGGAIEAWLNDCVYT